MIADGLQNGSLVRTGLGQLDERLEYLTEQTVTLETPHVEIAINLHLVAGTPQLHQLVYLVDQCDRLSSGSIEA